jgi:hypothetical protein
MLGDFTWGWDAFVAIGTLGLALATGSLAWSTKALALASRKEERAQWRPALVPTNPAPVDYDDASGFMSFEIRNVGRGPAFGVNAQIRSGKRSLGASIPGEGGATVLPVGESFRLQARLTNPSERVRGLALEAEISYYDIAERWHQSIFTVVGRRPADRISDTSVVPQLEVASVFVCETERDLLPVLGSPKALTRQAREQRRLRHRWQALAGRLRRRP